jgi:hypothetical protein
MAIRPVAQSLLTVPLGFAFLSFAGTAFQSQYFDLSLKWPVLAVGERRPYFSPLWKIDLPGPRASIP